MITVDTRETSETFEQAVNLALHEASRHNDWSRAEVMLPLGTERGAYSKLTVQCRIWSCDERRPDALSGLVEFPFEKGGPFS